MRPGLLAVMDNSHRLALLAATDNFPHPALPGGLDDSRQIERPGSRVEGVYLQAQVGWMAFQPGAAEVIER